MKKSYCSILVLLLILCGCNKKNQAVSVDSSNRVQIVDVAGKPIRGAAVSGVSASMNGQQKLTNSSGYASVPLFIFIQPVKWIKVDCVGYEMVQVQVPAKYPFVITLRKP